ncbi:MAG: ankyrin repeat domain-containing protein [Thiofilum sp.]|uniref:ankyrin repeat domain-containing protein n=1 Tax=Thiofilum sp. TaxID=2212733 RepID=UPI0025E839B2|nr:ankyrin repeat domain-containing protein [Thiofilum sp.]MBK8454703.1 ankyrin repeat domain-containing protein [Thiofilum sp.]
MNWTTLKALLPSLVIALLVLVVSSAYHVYRQSNKQPTISTQTVAVPSGIEAQVLLRDKLQAAAVLTQATELNALLQLGADPGISGNKDQHSALTIALAGDQMSNAYAMLPYLRLDTFNTAQRAIFYAARRGDVRLLDQLMVFADHHPDHLLPDHSEATHCEIYQALANGHIAAAERLLPLRKDCPELVEHALKSAQLGVLEWLLKQRPELTATLPQRSEWMKAAVESGSVPIVRYWVSQGLTLDHADLAVAQGHLELVKYFHQHGDTLVRTPETLVQVAAKSNQMPVLDYLTQLGIPALAPPEQRQNHACSTLAGIAAETGNLKLLTQLLGKKSDTLAQWDNPCTGDTLLHSAVKGQQLALALSLSPKHINTQNKQGSTPLHIAVETGQLALVKYLLSQQANPSISDHSGNTPLHLALNPSYFNDANAIVFTLLAEKPELNIQNQQGKTPLILAAEAGETLLARYLLQENADAAMVDNEGKSALHRLVERQVETIEDLALYIKQGADLNTLDYSGAAVLHKAAQYELKTSPSVLEQLIEARAKLNLSNQEGQTALHLAILAKQTRNALLLIAAGADITGADESGNTPLHYAAQQGLHLVLDQLLAKGADVHAINNDGNPVVFMAQNQTIIEKLTQAGAKFNTNTEQGVSLIAHLSSQTDKRTVLPMIEQALQAGADPNEQDTFGQTALQRSVRYNSPEITQLLLKYQADPNLADQEGNTPLHLAIRGRSLIQTHLLLQAGANINAVNSFGKTPLHQSIELVELGIANTLLQAGASIHTKDNDQRTPLQTALALNLKPFAHKLLNLGADIHNRSKGDWTALHYAAQLGDEFLIIPLLELGAAKNTITWGKQVARDLIPSQYSNLKSRFNSYPDKQDNFTENDQWQNTPLHRAVRQADIKQITRLLNQGANPNTKNHYGETALHYAFHIAPHYPDDIEVMLSLLFNAKADPLITDAAGRSSLEIALAYPINLATLNHLLNAQAQQVLTDSAVNLRVVNQLSKQSLATIQALLPPILKDPTIDQFSIWQWSLTHNQKQALIPWLLNQGLDPNLPVDDYTHIMNWALTQEYYDTIPLLLNANLSFQSTPDDISLLKTLLDKKLLKPAEFLVNHPSYQFEFAHNPDLAQELLLSVAAQGDKALAINTKLLSVTELKTINLDPIIGVLLQNDALETLKLYQKSGFNLKDYPNLVNHAVNANAFKILIGVHQQGLELKSNDNNDNLILKAIAHYNIDMVTYLINHQVPFSQAQKNQVLETLKAPSHYALSSNIDEADFVFKLARLIPKLTIKAEQLESIILEGRLKLAKAFLTAWPQQWTNKDYQFLLSSLVTNVSTIDNHGFDLIDLLRAKIPLFDFTETLNVPLGASPSYLLTRQAHNLPLLQHLANTNYVFKTAELEALFHAVLNQTTDQPATTIERLKWLSTQAQFKVSINLFAGLYNDEYLSEERWFNETHAFILELFKNQPIASTPLLALLNHKPLCSQYTSIVLKQIKHTDHNTPWLEHWVKQHYQQAALDQTLVHPELNCLSIPAIRQALFNIPSLKTQWANYGFVLINNFHDLTSMQNTWGELIKLGADLNYRDPEGNNLAHLWLNTLQASQQDDITAPTISEWLQGLYWLKQQGVDLLALDTKQRSILQRLLINEALPEKQLTQLNNIIEQLLILEPKLSTLNTTTDSPLHLTIHHTALADEHKLVLAKLLVKSGVDLNILNHKGNSPLLSALEAKAWSVAHWLLSQPIDFNIQNLSGQNALHLLILNQHFDLAQNITTKIKPLNALDGQGNNVLHYLARQECSKTHCKALHQFMKKLISLGLDINAQNKDGETPIMLAIYANHQHTLVNLLELKPNLNLTNKLGYVALQLALDQQHTQQAEQLIATGANINYASSSKLGKTLNHYITQLQDYGLVQTLLAYHSDWTIPDKIKNLAVPEDYWYKLLKDKRSIAINASSAITIPEYYRAANDTNNSLLHVATAANEPKVIRALLDKGLVVDITNSTRETPLHWAIQSDALASMQLLLKRGANPNALNQANKNAILIAANLAHDAMLRALLITTQQEAIELNINQRDENGNTALHLAVLNQNPIIIELLLAAGADTEIYNNDSLTPLLLAIEKPNLTIVKSLLGYKADLNAIDQQDRSVLLHAVERFVHDTPQPTATQLKQHLALLELLIDSGADLKAQSIKGNNALYIGIAKYALAKYLLTKPFDVKQLNYERETVLFQAARTHTKDYELDYLFKELIKQGIDINQRNIYGETALQAAVRHDNLPALLKLIELGADPNIVKSTELDNTGYNLPMYILASTYINPNTKLAVLDQIIKAGANLNHTNNNGENALFIAARIFEKPLDYVEWLVDQGIQLNISNLKGQYLPHILVEQFPYLSEYSANTTRIKRLLSHLRQKGLNTNARDMNSKTALHYAVARNNLTWVKLLLEQGANPNIQDNTDNSPLLMVLNNYATYAESWGLVDLLLQSGANPNLRNSAGQTALHLSYRLKNQKLIERLIKSGANSTIRSYIGRLATEEPAL